MPLDSDNGSERKPAPYPSPPSMLDRLKKLMPERERLQQIYLSALLAFAQIQFENQDFNSALALGKQVLTVDSCQEEAHRLLMRIYAAQRNPVLIIRQYELCCKALRDDLAAEPSTQTRALYQTLTR